MKTLKEYTDLQKLTGATDMEIITAYFVDNDMEEEMMEVSHNLAKAKIKKLRERKHVIEEWAYTIPSDYLYENYPVKTATMLHRVELDYIVNGKVTGARLEWAKENLSDIEKPKVYFQTCVRWLEEQGIKFKENTPVIPPLRIKLEPTGIVGKDWLQGAHGDIDGDSVMTIGMRPGGDIVQGLVSDVLKEAKNET